MPSLHKLAITDAEYINAMDGHLMAARRCAEERARVGAGKRPVDHRHVWPNRVPHIQSVNGIGKPSFQRVIQIEGDRPVRDPGGAMDGL